MNKPQNPGSVTQPQAVPARSSDLRNLCKIALALTCALVFHSLNLGDALTPQGHGILSTLLFMVLIWVTEAVSYSVSSFFLIVSMTLFTAFAVNPSTGQMLGTGKA